MATTTEVTLQTGTAVVFEGTLTGNIATEAPVTFTGTDPATVPLTVLGAPAQSADIMDVTEETASFGLFVGADGSVTLAAPTGGSIGLGNTTTLILVDGSTNALGFFGHAVGTQPAITGSLSTVIDAAAKAVLASIIAALVGIGLATDGTT